MPATLEQIDQNLWHAVHSFRAYGIAVTSRMTVVRMADSSLWLHSPVPISTDLQRQLDALGPVRHVIAPNRYHHLYAGDALRKYPQAELLSAPGLRAKRTDLATARDIDPESVKPWRGDLDHIAIEGLPMLSESVWLHRATSTLIATDLIEWLSGDLPLSARMYGHFQGVRTCLAVPRSFKWIMHDRAAVGRSLESILRWPVKRVVVNHNVILEEHHDAAGQLRRALETFMDRCGVRDVR